MRRTMVSVVMITYGHENFLKEAINGVLEQECNFNVELIIADDNSPDGTKEIVESFENHRNYNWIKYTRHTKNIGIAANFNWVFENANGRYIALCEGDDYWIDSRKLSKQVEFLEVNDQYTFVAHNVLKKNFLGVYEDYIRYKSDFEILFEDYVQLKYGIPTCSVVLRNNFTLPPWFLKTKMQDLPLFLFLLNKGKGFYMRNQMAVYRKHAAGESIKFNGILGYYAHLEVLKEFEKNERVLFRKKLRQQISIIHFRISLSSKIKKESCYNMWYALKYRPLAVFILLFKEFYKVFKIRKRNPKDESFIY